MNHRVAVLIPCLNEAPTIAAVIGEVRQNVPDAAIYVYDNNSTDNTAFVAGQAGAIVRSVSDPGKGRVIRQMLREIDAECYVMVDGDNTYSLKELNRMISLVLDLKCDMVIGDRVSGSYQVINKKPLHGFGNRLVNALINMLYKSRLKDAMSGLRVFSNRLAKGFPAASNGFEVEVEMDIHAIKSGYSIAQIPIEYRDRVEGTFSKISTVVDGIRIVWTILSDFLSPVPLLPVSSLAVGILSMVLTVRFLSSPGTFSALSDLFPIIFR